jgi:hypothetical protein
MAKSIDKAVLDGLKHSGLNKQNLAELVRIIGTINASGVRPIKVLPNGIPTVDGVTVNANINAGQLDTLVGLLTTLPRLDNIRVFPKGIPVIDNFEVGLEFR